MARSGRWASQTPWRELSTGLWSLPTYTRAFLSPTGRGLDSVNNCSSSNTLCWLLPLGCCICCPHLVHVSSP